MHQHRNFFLMLQSVLLEIGERDNFFQSSSVRQNNIKMCADVGPQTPLLHGPKLMPRTGDLTQGRGLPVLVHKERFSWNIIVKRTKSTVFEDRVILQNLFHYQHFIC